MAGDDHPGGHIPVMLAEAMAALAPAPGGLFLDGTFGGGGYARAILETGADLIALDRDPAAVERGAALAQAFPGRLRLRQGRFGALDKAADRPLQGIVLDVGVSSFQIDEAERGFSFRFDAPLDMRMEAVGRTAAAAVNGLSEAALADVIFNYGEDRNARRIARAIVAARAQAPIGGTAALAALVERAVGGRRGAKIHPATRTFQALRILVNDELGELARGLSAAERALAPGGRLVVVSFHSLEDRLVKSFLHQRLGESGGSRHAPAVRSGPPPSFAAARRAAPGAGEAAENPRARSAQLRWAVRTEAPAWDEIEPPGPKAALAEWARL